MRQVFVPNGTYQHTLVDTRAMESSFHMSQGSEIDEMRPPSLEEGLPKVQDKLFIGGISLQVNLPDLESRLKLAAGLAFPIKITMVDRTDSNSFSGYGFVTLANAQDQSRLLALKTFKYKKCWIGIKPFLTNKTDIKKLKSQKADRKLHIKGITQRIQEKDLEQYFSYFGDINHIQINKSQATGHYKGFAFIEFTDKTAVDRVILNPYHTIKDVCLVCEKSRVKTIDIPGLIPTNDLDKEHNNRTRNSLSFSKPVVNRSSLPKISFARVAANHTITNINFNLSKRRAPVALLQSSSRPTSGH